MNDPESLLKRINYHANSKAKNMKHEFTTPKRIWVHHLINGKTSFAEYIWAKRNNICEPFNLNDVEALNRLKEQLKTWRLRNNNRPIEFVGLLKPEILKQLI